MADHLPAFLRSTAISFYRRIPVSFRSSVYREYRRLLESHRTASRAELVAYRDSQLARLIEHAYENVPYYRDLMRERSLTPSDITTVADLGKLPLLTKDDVMEHHDRLVARNISPRMRLPMNTGGSTGRTLSFYITRRFTLERQLAFIHDQWSRVGYRAGDRMVRIRGDPPPKQGSFASFDRAQNTLALSTYNVTAKRIREVQGLIEDFNPRFLHVYPSSIVYLTQLFEDGSRKPRLPELSAILCGSENLYDDQRRFLRSYWGCRVYAWYGHGEFCLLGGGCESSDTYHFFPEYGALELIADEGAWSRDGVAEMVGTGFGNPVMPFIRYRTQDFARSSGTHCDDCGRSHDLVPHVEGRLQEYVVTSDNRIISVTSLIWGQHYRCFGRIAKFQIIQEEPGVVVIRVVRRSTFRPEDEVELRERTEAATGHVLKVEIEFVSDIEPTRRGKHKFVVQQLPIGIGD